MLKLISASTFSSPSAQLRPFSSIYNSTIVFYHRKGEKYNFYEIFTGLKQSIRDILILVFKSDADATASRHF